MRKRGSPEERQRVAHHNAHRRHDQPNLQRVAEDAQIERVEKVGVVFEREDRRQLNAPGPPALHQADEQHDEQRQVEEQDQPQHPRREQAGQLGASAAAHQV
jgi:hypothetical protein